MNECSFVHVCPPPPPPLWTIVLGRMMNECLPVCLHVWLGICVIVCLPLFLCNLCSSERSYVYLTACLFVCLPIYLCIRLFICMYVCLSVCLHSCQGVAPWIFTRYLSILFWLSACE